jgi:glutaredoxin
MVKKYLTLKGVEYEAVDVTNDPEKRQELLEKTGMMSVPVTTNGDNYVVGFKPADLAKLIA